MSRGHPSKKDIPRPASMRDQLESAMKQAKAQVGESPEGRALDILAQAFQKAAASDAPSRSGGRPLAGFSSPVMAAYVTWLQYAKIGDEFIAEGHRRTQLGAYARERGHKVTTEQVVTVRGTKAEPLAMATVIVTLVEDDDEATPDPGSGG